jgi:hypothetical protein
MDMVSLAVVALMSFAGTFALGGMALGALVMVHHPSKW